MRSEGSQQADFLKKINMNLQEEEKKDNYNLPSFPNDQYD